ncbi:MAG: ADP-ribosylation factor-like protein [Promethearchaeota archaeon]
MAKKKSSSTSKKPVKKASKPAKPEADGAEIGGNQERDTGEEQADAKKEGIKEETLEWAEIPDKPSKKRSNKKSRQTSGKATKKEVDEGELEPLSLPDINKIVSEEVEGDGSKKEAEPPVKKASSKKGSVKKAAAKKISKKGSSAKTPVAKPSKAKGPPAESVPSPEDVEIPDSTAELDIIDEDELSSPDLVESIKAQGSKPHEAWKILFSGLDFAGKSSILATIKHEFQKLVNPQPTKLTERSTFSFLGQEVAEWDLGGQRLYRIQYLKRPVKYYADTSILFYVIDVLDEERYDEAIDFLYDTLQLFDTLNINPLISILFHKMDPDVVKEAKKSRIEMKITQLTNKIKVLTYGRDVLFFRTSIFDSFTVIDAFSKSMLELFPEKNVVDYALAELAQKTEANIIILLDENRYILGQNIISSDDRQYDELVKLSKDTLLSFLYLHENFKLYPFLNSNYMIIQLERFSFLWVQIKQKEHSFYLIVFKDGADFQSLLNMDVKSIGTILIKLIKQD